MAWRQPNPTDSRFSVDVVVPANSSATLTVASTGLAGITEGGKPIHRAKGVRLLGVNGGGPPAAQLRHLRHPERDGIVTCGRTGRPADRGSDGAAPWAARTAATVLAGLAGTIAVAGAMVAPKPAGASPPGPLNARQLASGAADACIVGGGSRPTVAWSQLSNPILSAPAAGVKDEALVGRAEVDTSSAT